MNIRLLKSQDTQVLEEYLAPHKAECMFICSNLKAAGIEYSGSDFEGEYFGYFNTNDQLQGVIVHYWNGNLMMHAKDHGVLEKLILHLKKNTSRPVAGILGPNIQAEHVIKKLGLSGGKFGINSNEGLYEINLEALNELNIPSNMKVVPAQDVPKSILTLWMKSYDIEALGVPDSKDFGAKFEEDLNRRLKQNDTWVLLLDETPVALSAFNARLTDMVQVGPVWTPPEHRNKGYARLLLAYTLYQEKLKGTKQAILFTDNPAAIKAYLAIGFKKIGNYRLALLEKPINIMKQQITRAPLTAERKASIYEAFAKHAIDSVGFDGLAQEPVAFEIMENDVSLGVVVCQLFWGNLHIKYLLTNKEHRGRGIARALMEHAFAFGKENGCHFAFVETMSFQAPEFYQKLGFEIELKRDGYAAGTSFYYLKKVL